MPPYLLIVLWGGVKGAGLPALCRRFLHCKNLRALDTGLCCCSAAPPACAIVIRQLDVIQLPSTRAFCSPQRRPGARCAPGRAAARHVPATTRGVRAPNYTTISVLINYPGARRAPGKLCKMWGLILYIFGGVTAAVLASARAPPSRPGARRAPGRGGSARNSERDERLASERAALARLRPRGARSLQGRA